VELNESRVRAVADGQSEFAKAAAAHINHALDLLQWPFDLKQGGPAEQRAAPGFRSNPEFSAEFGVWRAGMSSS
jgi:hypothetical protein